MFNLFSTFNGTYINQGNIQLAQNLAIASPGAQQTIFQGATNNVTVFQLGK
jgi:hypothetical protein